MTLFKHPNNSYLYTIDVTYIRLEREYVFNISYRPTSKVLLFEQNLITVRIFKQTYSTLIRAYASGIAYRGCVATELQYGQRRCIIIPKYTQSTYAVPFKARQNLKGLLTCHGENQESERRCHRGCHRRLPPV